MKKKATAVLAALLLSATLGRATLIDLTPGGFDLTQPWPEAVLRFFGFYNGMQYIAGANIVDGHPDWSPFTLFGPEEFSMTLDGPSAADVGWNLSGTGFHLQYVFVERFIGNGSVEIDGTIPLLGVVFAGSDEVPDAGYTLMLFGIAITAVVFLHRRYQSMNDERPGGLSELTTSYLCAGS